MNLEERNIKIKAKYSQLPTRDTASNFFVQFLEPLPMTFFQIISLPHYIFKNKSSLEELKKALLQQWKEITSKSEIPDEYHKVCNELPDSLKDLGSVDLIECDLLVPKDERSN